MTGKHVGISGDWQFQGSSGVIKDLVIAFVVARSGDRNPGWSSRIGAIQPPQKMNQQLRQKMLVTLLQVHPMIREGTSADLVKVQHPRPKCDLFINLMTLWQVVSAGQGGNNNAGDVELLTVGDIIGPGDDNRAATRWRHIGRRIQKLGYRFTEAIHLRVPGHFPPHIANQTKCDCLLQ
ncbi:hypothetical protein J6590_084902 [Homalodisca vitripennis]|nr:hypothetical protein J6590_084902 [Homalodisca vitripennis]